MKRCSLASFVRSLDGWIRSSAIPGGGNGGLLAAWLG